MKVNLLLADTARIAEGKLDALGIGWAMTVPGTPFSVCGVVHVPWDQASELHTLVLELIDGDGEPFCLPGQEGEPQPFTAEFKQEKPLRETINPQVKPGTQRSLGRSASTPGAFRSRRGCSTSGGSVSTGTTRRTGRCD